MCIKWKKVLLFFSCLISKHEEENGEVVNSNESNFRIAVVCLRNLEKPTVWDGRREGTVVKMKAQAHSNYVNISKLLNISLPWLSLK